MEAMEVNQPDGAGDLRAAYQLCRDAANGNREAVIAFRSKYRVYDADAYPAFMRGLVRQAVENHGDPVPSFLK